MRDHCEGVFFADKCNLECEALRVASAQTEDGKWELFLKTNMKLKLRSLVFCRCVFFLKGIFVGTLLLVF